jgi:hypothetical protein
MGDNERILNNKLKKYLKCTCTNGCIISVVRMVEMRLRKRIVLYLRELSDILI